MSDQTALEMPGTACLVHVDANDLAVGPDLVGSEEDIEAGATAQVDDGLSLRVQSSWSATTS